MSESSDRHESSKASSSSSSTMLPPIRTNSSTASQTKALFAKSLTYQRRQTKSNCCQILTPVILAILMFLLQRLVDSFVQAATGEGATIRGKPHPPIKPAFFLLSDNGFENCGAAFQFGAPMPNATGLTAGGCPRFQGESLPALNLSSWASAPLATPIGEPGCAGNVSGLLNAMPLDEPLIYYRSRVYPDRGNTIVVCDKAPFYAYPLNVRPAEASFADTQAEIFGSFMRFNSFGGYVFHVLDAVNHQLGVSVFLNNTLSSGLDYMRYSSLLTSATISTFSGGLNTTSFAGLKDFPTRDKPNSFDLISLIGPFFYVFVLQLQLPPLLSSIVHEKEHKLREIMKIMGLRMVPYYLVNYVVSFVFYFAVAIAFWIMCAILGFRYWSLNSPAAIFFLLFIWGHVLVATVFFFSTFFNKASSATVGGYLYVFGNSLIASIIVASFLDQPATPRWIIIICQLFPPFAFYRGLTILRNGVTFGEIGLQWADINNPRVQMGEVYGFLIMEWFVLCAASLYIELVFSSGFGVRKSPWFLCHRATYCREPKPDDEELDENAAQVVDGDAPDVAAERLRAVTSREHLDLRVVDLRKVYDARAGAPPKVAVKQLSLGLSAGTCLGFLGPNGAGKSTMISMIAGLFAPTAGAVHVAGYDSARDPDIVHLNLGVCTQDDLLWPDLTSTEHLRFYGRLKNIPKAEINDAIDEILGDVSLGDPATRKKLVKEYSGGMKRRLSVACALIGYPRLVLLDEPSTGLDPASRQQLWKVIRKYKKRCAMLLTTHSMEEAEELCDRVSIFVDGQLRAIGSSPELKLTWGMGYKITTLSTPENEARVDQFIRSLSPSVQLLNALAGTRNYEVPKGDINVANAFRSINENAERLGLKDWGIANTTLEEVFLKILVASGWEHIRDLGAAGAASSAPSDVPMQNMAPRAESSSEASYYSESEQQQQQKKATASTASSTATDDDDDDDDDDSV